MRFILAKLSHTLQKAKNLAFAKDQRTINLKINYYLEPFKKYHAETRRKRAHSLYHRTKN